MGNFITREQLDLETSRTEYKAWLLKKWAAYIVNKASGNAELILGEGEFDAKSEMNEHLEPIFRNKVTEISEKAAREYQEQMGKLSFDELMAQRVSAHEALKHIETNPIDFSGIVLDEAKIQKEISFDEEKGSYTVGYIEFGKRNEEFTRQILKLQEILGKSFPDGRSIQDIGYWLDPISKEVKAVMMTIGSKEWDDDFSRAGTLILKADGKKIFLPDIIEKQYLAVAPSGRLVMTFSTEVFHGKWNDFVVKDIPMVYNYRERNILYRDRIPVGYEQWNQWIGGRGVFDEDFYVATNDISSSLWKKVFLENKPDDWNWSFNNSARKENGKFTVTSDWVGGIPQANCYFDTKNQVVVYPMPDYFARGGRFHGKNLNWIFDTTKVLEMKS